jgi:hypothetical protein
MIHFIPHDRIDRTAYDRCVEASSNFRIYAMSWYLDAVALTWDVLVLDDYAAVMPLPRRSKFGLSYVYTPAFVQQLGVFSPHEMESEEECQFYKRAFSKYVLMDYFAHAWSKCATVARAHRTNYTLRLDKSHTELRKGFNTNRKRLLRQATGELRTDREGDPGLFLEMSTRSSTGYKLDDSALAALERLLSSDNPAIRVWNVFHRDRWVGGLVWTLDSRRITYLFPMQDSHGKELQVHTHVIDTLIEDHAGSGLILDLEGSMLPGVAKFYRSFGAEVETYFYYKSRAYGFF